MMRHDFKYAQQRWIFRWLVPLFNAPILLKLRRWLMRFSPFLRLESQATDTVYLSWLVDVDLVRHRFPEPIRLWEKDGKTIFSILFYHHHHFGLHCLGPLRKVFPSPRQSNWRFYLADELLPKTVIFEQIVVDQMLYVSGGRLLSDAMPAQFDPNFQHTVQQTEQGLKVQANIYIDKRYHMQVSLASKAEQILPSDWATVFPDWDSAMQYLVPQEHVWVECVDQPMQLSQANIRIETAYQAIQALKLEQLECPLLREFGITEQDQALCFYLPNLDFHVLGEQVLDHTAHSNTQTDQALVETEQIRNSR